MSLKMSRKKDLWFGDNLTFQKRQNEIKEANRSGTNYEVVRCLQQTNRQKKAAVDTHITAYSGCMDCPLGGFMLGSSKVFFRGYVPCDVLYIGEAPGMNEQTHTIPFIGESGKVIDRIIKETHMRVSTNQSEAKPSDNCIRWCITNSVLCIPFEEGKLRNPHRHEMKACSKRLQSFISICQPKLIVQVGLIAADAMKLFQCPIPQVFIPHPAWMIRQKADQELHEKKAYLYLSETIKKMVAAGTITLVGA